LKENRRKQAKEEKLKRAIEIKKRMDYEEAMKRDAEKRQQQKHEKEIKGQKISKDKIWTLKAENAALRETLARLKEEKLIAYSEHFPTLPKKEESLESSEKQIEQRKQVEQPKQQEQAKQQIEQPKQQEERPKQVEKQQKKPVESVQKERLPLDQAQEIMASNVMSKPIELEESQQESEKPLEKEQEQEELTATDKYFVHHVVQPNISFADAVKMNPEEAELKRKRFEEQQAKKEVAQEFHRDKHAVSQEVVLQEMKAAPIKTENPFDILNQADAMSA
jgi:colicin import membrane protein